MSNGLLALYGDRNAVGWRLLLRWSRDGLGRWLGARRFADRRWSGGLLEDSVGRGRSRVDYTAGIIRRLTERAHGRECGRERAERRERSLSAPTSTSTTPQSAENADAGLYSTLAQRPRVPTSSYRSHERSLDVSYP
jgi:hypothetical protein